MVIPFPLLYKLKVDRRKRWVLIAIFALPTIPIIFAILRLVTTNPNTHNVDPIKFQLFSLLENTAAIVTSCLPALRLFVTKSHNTTIYSDSQKYSQGRRGGYDITGSMSSKQQAGIPFNSLSYTHHDAHVVHDRGVIRKAASKDSDEEFLNPTPSRGVLVTQEYHVT